jgi:hypothetical protein
MCEYNMGHCRFLPRLSVSWQHGNVHYFEEVLLGATRFDQREGEGRFPCWPLDFAADGMKMDMPVAKRGIFSASNTERPDHSFEDRGKVMKPRGIIIDTIIKARALLRARSQYSRRTNPSRVPC